MIMLRDVLTERRRKQLWYLPVLGSAMGLMMLRILAMARMLDVAAFGTYSAGLLVSGTFCMLGCLGLQSMLQRDMPVMLMRLRSRAALVLLLQCLLVALACAAAGMLASNFFSSVAGLPSIALSIGIAHGLSQQVFLLVTVESRSRGEPLRYAFQNFWRAACILAASTAVAGQTGSATWVLLAEAAVSLALSYATLDRNLRQARISLAGIVRVAARRLGTIRWHTALVLFLVSVLGFLQVNVDRWAAAELLTAERFALYSFAAIVLTVAQSVQSMMNASVYPMLSRRFAVAGLRVTFRLSAGISIATLAAGLLLAIPGLLVFEGVIDRWFPAYRASTGLLVIFFGIAVLRVSDFWSSFLMISGHETRLLILDALVLFAGAAIWWPFFSAYRAGHSDLLLYAMLAALLAAGHYVCGAGMAWRILHRSRAKTTVQLNF